MPVSEARLAANRANALKSCGPKTPEGKERSRRNSLRHGMAGRGVVTPADDSAEVERRTGAMLVEMAPRTEMGQYLVGRLAELTVRVERCSRHERAAVEAQAVHAEAAFDEARIAEVDSTIPMLAREPATMTRRLRSMPEGIDRMIAHLLDLREELNTGRWDWSHGDKVANLTGRRWMEVPVTRVRALSEAINGDFQFLLPGDGDGLSDLDRVDWARNAMADLIDAEIDMLLAHRATLDVEAIERDRAGAADRALFDPSKEAVLARRYEAAAERAVYRALRELKEVEASSTVPPEPEVVPSLGSSGEEDPEETLENVGRSRPRPDRRARGPGSRTRPRSSGRWMGGIRSVGPVAGSPERAWRVEIRSHAASPGPPCAPWAPSRTDHPGGPWCEGELCWDRGPGNTPGEAAGSFQGSGRPKNPSPRPGPPRKGGGEPFWPPPPPGGGGPGRGGERRGRDLWRTPARHWARRKMRRTMPIKAPSFDRSEIHFP